jgi:hypothetical protein
MDSSAGCEGSSTADRLDVEAAAGDTSKIDLIRVPGEGSSTGNVTGGRKFARHHFVARPSLSFNGASADKGFFTASEFLPTTLRTIFSTNDAHHPNVKRN